MTRILLCLVLGLLASGALAQTLPRAITDEDYAPVRLEEAKLGQLLFYDPILSGNRKVACATCHHPKFGTSDGVSLSFGDGGKGLGPKRVADPDNLPEERIPRNAPALFNLGAHEFTVMFHDGRLEADPAHPSGIRTPMDADMLDGFASVLSAQTMFPVLSRDEMAGSYAENEVAKLVRQGRITGAGGAWDVLSKRVAGVPTYAAAFVDLYSHISDGDDIRFADISNAIAVFMAHEWRSDQSPFDAVLRGEATPGGPGKSATFEDHHRDDGRFRVTGREEDRYAFRTPSLRNIALTGPYGHAGGHRDLAAFVADHADPVAGLKQYDRTQAVLPAFEAEDFAVMDHPAEVQAIADAVSTKGVSLSAEDVAAIVAFLNTLTDPQSIDGRLGVPKTVPSGLSVP